MVFSAEAALSRKEEVDIEGGWKVGDPYVHSQISTCILLTVHCGSVPYAALTKAFSLIEATTKRIEKTSLLTAFLLLVIQRSANGDTKSLLQAVYLCINRVCYLLNSPPLF
jgi:DNA ligase 1